MDILRSVLHFVLALAEEMAQKQIKLETPPFDARFPNTNQTKNCWQNYVDYHKCLKAKGEDYEPCQYFKRVFTSLCPHAWVSFSNTTFSCLSKLFVGLF